MEDTLRQASIICNSKEPRAKISSIGPRVSSIVAISAVKSEIEMLLEARFDAKNRVLRDLAS